MSDDLATFLRARLDEDESIARAATPGPWSVDSETYAERIGCNDGTSVVSGSRWNGEASVFNETDDALHIARHDPARVLAEVDAKRKVIAVYTSWAFLTRSKPDDPVAEITTLAVAQTLRALALPYVDHPGYREEWAFNS